MPIADTTLATAATTAAASALRFGLARPSQRATATPAPTPISTWAVTVGMFVFAAVWLAQLASTNLSPPVDDIEQLSWVRSLEWGYYKHPPLPTWLLWLPVRLFGLSASTVYVVGAIVTLAALAIYWRLLVNMRGAAYALVALLAAACITYYNGRLHYYNHNVVLLLASTASAALCWQAFTTRRRRWWLALGVVVGLGALAKYQIAVTVLCILVFAVHQRAWRDVQQRQGLLLAVLAALVLFSPHIRWLQLHDYGPVGYALDSSLGAHADLPTRTVGSAHWLLDQLFNRALPAFLLLAMATLLAGRTAQPAAHEPTPLLQADRQAARALLLSWGFVPLLFIPLVGIFTGAKVQLHWGTPFLLFVVPAVMEMAPRTLWQRPDRKALLAAFVAIQALLLGVSHQSSQRGLRLLTDTQALNTAWNDTPWCHIDAQAIAHAVGPLARSALAGPVRVVSGPAAMAGALALALPEHPVVLIDGRFDQSPWVPRTLLASCGGVEIGTTPDLPLGTEIGASLPGWSWQVMPPDSKAALACSAAATRLRVN